MNIQTTTNDESIINISSGLNEIMAINSQEKISRKAKANATSALFEQPAVSTAENFAYLSDEEKHELQENERIIAHGWQSFVEVGKALARIRDGRLYRQEFKTFDNYCHLKWQYGRHYANHLIAAAEIVTQLVTIVTTAPQNESQVRPLIGLPREAVVDTWKKAEIEAQGGTITADLVKKAAAEFRSQVSSSSQKKGRKKKQKRNSKQEIRDKILQLIKNAEFFLKSKNLDNIGPILTEIKAIANQITD